MLRVVSVIMLILLLLCVIVQFNDPDGLVWMLIYGYGTVVTAFAVAKRYTVFAVVGVVGYLAGFFYWLPGIVVENPTHLLTDLQMGERGVEEAREAIGLLIAAAWMLVLSIVWYRNRSRSLVD
ncbi:MAG: hypothetical protein KJ060_03770 [Candidatus Hydrogenedentes bacterium]|nr:hypothetical protein [Candidatus Hydrogenedentota bacterium]